MNSQIISILSSSSRWRECSTWLLATPLRIITLFITTGARVKWKIESLFHFTTSERERGKNCEINVNARHRANTSSWVAKRIIIISKAHTLHYHMNCSRAPANFPADCTGKLFWVLSFICSHMHQMEVIQLPWNHLNATLPRCLRWAGSFSMDNVIGSC